MAAVEGPFCFAVADDEGAGSCHCRLSAPSGAARLNWWCAVVVVGSERWRGSGFAEGGGGWRGCSRGGAVLAGEQ